MIVLLLLLAAFSLRVYGLNWDDAHLFHPDERFILMVSQKLALPSPLSLATLADPGSPLNPQSFAYGSLSFYLLAIVTQFLARISPLVQPWTGHAIQVNLDDMRLVGRTISALFDTGTVLLTYLLGSKLYSGRVGMIAAAFVAFSVINIQLAHFYASDTLLTFFILLTMLAALGLTRGAGFKRSALVGGAVGLALATKASAAPIWLIVIAAHVLRMFVDWRWRDSQSTTHGYGFTTDPSAEGQGRRDEEVGDVVAAPRGGARDRSGSESLVMDTLPDGGMRASTPSGALIGRVPAWRELRDTILSLVVSGIVAAVVFVVIQPYVIIDFKTFIRNVAEQSAMVRGIADLPYTRQYIGTTPYLYHLQNLVVWGLGIPLGALVVGGLAYVLGRTLSNPRWQDLLMLSWVLPYAALTGSFHAKFVRYLLPMVPFLSIFAATLLVALWVHLGRDAAQKASVSAEGPGSADVLSRGRRALWRVPAQRVLDGLSRARTPTFVIVALVIAIPTVFYAVAFVNIYSVPHTAVQGSKWIYSNVLKGSSIAIEHWEEGMPVPLNDGKEALSAGGQGYRTNVLELYEVDGPAKLNHIVDRLVSSDYIIFFSNRLYSTIPRLPERYPLTTRYYHLLFGEQLGFELEAAFTSYPNLFGVATVDDTFGEAHLPVPAKLRDFQPAPITLNLGKADESLTVYDHPKVLVFKKTEKLTAAELANRLGGDGQSAPLQKTGLLLSGEQRRKMTSGGTFRDIFDRDGLKNQIPIIVWVVLVQLLGLVAMPIAFRALGGLPDRGYGVAKALGILLLAWSTWIVASVGLLPNSRETVILMLLLVLSVGIGLFLWQRSRLIAFWRAKLGLIVLSELVFWGAFALFLGIRMANPDLWHPYRGGEKPMDLAYLMAVLKSAQFPPYDPWFAGGYMNYYYFGQVIVGTLIKLSGIVPTTAYNLAIPTLFALAASGAFSLTHALATKPGENRLDPGAVLTGLGGAAFALLLGNLGGALQILEKIAQIGAAGDGAGPPTPISLWSLANGFRLVVSRAKAIDIPSDWYWGSTRVIEGTINEFPFFTFLYADLHAHLIALAFTLLALAFAVHFVKARSLSAWSIGLAALVLGSLYVTNSWDFPTYALVLGAAILLSWYQGRPADWRGLLRRALAVVALGALAILLYLPFHRSFQSFYFGVQPFPDKSSLAAYLVVNGLFIFILLSFLISDVVKSYGDAASLRTIRLVVGSAGRGERLARLYPRLVKGVSWRSLDRLALIAACLAILSLLVRMNLQVVALLAGMLLLALMLLAKRTRPAEEMFVIGLIVVGLVLGIGVEFVVIKGDVGRMNTVFKFYLQVWTLWSIAGALAVRWVLRQAVVPRLRWRGRIWLGALTLLVASAGVYPVVATRARVTDRFDNGIAPTLDGTAFMRTGVYRDQPGPIDLASDLKAILWIQDNVVGSPVMLEGRAPLYSWGSRVSIYTGLPTVLGWDWHQKQQRWGYQWMVDKRAGDVATMYNTLSPEQAMGLLKEYGVSYIYVGELERRYYSAPGLQKFDAMVGRDLDVVYDADGVRIYRLKG
ncbi:MAG: glycosyltransferase family 39 protein [Chloroflexi bacterium]|nr:glycosyltransferase family 39 protein [Chloroflexota bacterium]